MPELSQDIVTLLQYLAPGLVVAWVYYGLTSHVKPSQFERVVQALIFTVVVQVLVIGERFIAEWMGRLLVLGEWSPNVQLISSMATALALGVGMSMSVNADAFHRWMREAGISKRSGHPCEWFGIFSEYQRYVVLQLKDGTRIYGWPKVWPSEYERGHFFITNVLRSVGDQEQELDTLDGLLVDVHDVSSVEFVKPPEKVNGKTPS